MRTKIISMSDRFARYFITLLIGNNIFSLFLALCMYGNTSLDFMSLLIFNLAVAHSTSIICLIAIDAVDIFLHIKKPNRIKFSSTTILLTVACSLGPSLWFGFKVGTLISRSFNFTWQLKFSDIVRPGIPFGILVSIMSLIFVQWLNNIKARYAQEAALINAERRVLQARFDLLAKELHPHLLFNIIQNVLSLMVKDLRAKKMLEELAVYYQDILLIIDKPSITLGEELTLCRHYMALQKSRYPDLLLTIESDRNNDAFMLPPLFLQPLLENAIKFTIAHDGKCKNIEINIKAIGSLLQIAIVNPHNKKSIVKPGFSKGLKNSEQRMKEFFGDLATLTMTQNYDKTFVIIDMPYAAQATN